MDRLARPLEDADYRVVREWYRGWTLSIPPRELLPDTGRIVPGVCAGFLYLTNSGIGLLENYISNPEASKELRDEGLDELTHSLLALAKENGVVALRCETKMQQVIERAKKFNFQEIPQGRLLVRGM